MSDKNELLAAARKIRRGCETSYGDPAADFYLRVADWLEAESWLLDKVPPLTETISLAMQQISGGQASITLGRKPDGEIDMQASSTPQALAVARAYKGGTE